MNPKIRDLDRVLPGMVLDIGVLDEIAPKAPLPISRKGDPLKVPGRAIASQERELFQHAVLVAPPAQEVAPANSGADTADVAETEVPAIDSRESKVVEFRADRFAEFSLEPSFYFSVLDSVDAASGGQATLLSKLNSSILFSWGQHWSDDFQTALRAATGRQSFEYQDAAITLDQASRNVSEFGVHLRGFPFATRKLSLESEFRLKQELFLRASGFSNLALDAIRIPEVSLGACYELLDLWPFTLRLNGSVRAYLPADASSYEVRSGSGFDFGADLGMQLSRTLRMRGGVFYRSRSENSSIASLNERDIGFTLGMTYRLVVKPEKEDGL